MVTKVSIVIPTYKRPALLKRCIDSLLSQDFPKEEFEIIIITDGPDEETLSMVQQFTCNTCFKNISCYCLPSKKGPAAARNAGWKIGKGRLILFTDDDCIAHKDWVKYYFNAFEFYAEPFIAFTGRIIVPRSTHPTDFELNTAHLEHADFVTANCACSKMALEKVNGFDEAFTMAWREDSDLEFKFLKQDIPINKIEEAVIIHPVRKAPWGVSLKEQKKSMFNALLFKKHPGLYRERIMSSILWNYYLMIFLFVTFFVAWHYDEKIIAIICISTWAILLGLFVSKRLSNASRSFNHVAEMIATSILIPFISVFWNLYGAYKFKALRL
jgi:glycosyltransferase involved in cell wall biosynthesis